jgi:hypothetical protein
MYHYPQAAAPVGMTAAIKISRADLRRQEHGERNDPNHEVA